MKVLLLVLAVAMLVVSQKVDLLIIDDFSAGPQTIIITIPSSPTFPVKQSSIAAPTGTNINILGGERDLELSVGSGTKNLILSTQISTDDQEYRISTPNGASGFSHVQYDGKDNSITLSPAGLGAIDLTFAGSANQFKTTIDSDHATTYTLTVTSPGKTCSAEIDIGEAAGEQSHTVNFSQFDGNCDFTKIGSIDVQVEALVAVDASLKTFTVIGTLPSASPPPPPPPSASKVPSDSRSNSPPPSPSKGASASAPPSVACLCHCPAFTCELIFDPDDDENNVFYFDDDADNDFPNNGDGNGAYGNGSDASTLAISLTTVFTAIFVNMF